MQHPDLNEPNQWIQAHTAYLVLFARQWTPDHADAEDVVHEAFLKFWPMRHQADSPIALLCSCVKRTAQSWHRSNQRRRRREAHYSKDLPLMMDTHHAETQEIRRIVSQSLTALSEQQREVIVLRIWGNLSFPQIAAALEISTSAADARYRTALQQMKSFLKPRLT